MTALWGREITLRCGCDGGSGEHERFCIMFCSSFFRVFLRLSGIPMKDLSKSKFIKYVEVLVILLFVWYFSS